MPIEESSNPIGNGTGKLKACSTVPQPTTLLLALIKISVEPENVIACSFHVTFKLYVASANATRGCFKKSFTALKAYFNLFRGQVQCFELS
jgi:hypothetical protein